MKHRKQRRPRKKLCPVCGEKVTDTGNRCKLGRIILSCGDAVWGITDKLGRVTWTASNPGLPGAVIDNDICGGCGAHHDTEQHAPDCPNAPSVKDAYPDGVCPDCQEPISDTASEGEACANCGHVFCLERLTDDGT